MAKMQSLEEDALLKGTLLAARQPVGSKGRFSSSTSTTARPKGSAGSNSGNRGGKVSAAAAGGAGGDDAEEPETDGDETDDYSDQVSVPPHSGCTAPSYVPLSARVEFRTVTEPSQRLGGAYQGFLQVIFMRSNIFGASVYFTFKVELWRNEAVRVQTSVAIVILSTRNTLPCHTKV